MQIEQTILVVGCQQSALNILEDTFHNSGIQLIAANYDYSFPDSTSLNAILIYLNETDIDAARKFLATPAVSRLQKILVIDPRNQALRLFSATVEIDEVVFKPVRVQELVARIQLIIQREKLSAQSEFSICDELDFAQKIQELAEEQLSGCLKLKGQELESEIYFDHGSIRGIRAERKIQSNATDALWRIFPANHVVNKNVSLPSWAEKEEFVISAKELTRHVVDAASFFHDNFADKYSLHTVFRISNSQYDRAFPKLPRQVRQIIQTFDGSRALFEVLNILNLSEMLTMQIILRLLQEKLIRECKPCAEGVSLTEWINSGEWVKTAVSGSENNGSDDDSRVTSVLSNKPFAEVETNKTPENNKGSDDDSRVTMVLSNKPFADGLGDKWCMEEASQSVLLFVEQSPEPGGPIKLKSPNISGDETKGEVVKAVSILKSEDKKEDGVINILSSKEKESAVSAVMDAMESPAPKPPRKPPVIGKTVPQAEKKETDHSSSDLEPIAYKSQKADLVDDYSVSTCDDSSVTADYIMPFRPETNFDSDTTAQIDVVDYLNKKPQDKDDNATMELSADLVVPKKLKAPTSNVESNPDDDNSDWFNEESDKETMRLKVGDTFSAEALYKEKHKDELTPAEWKEQVIQRMDNERSSRDKRIMGILIAAIAIAVIILIVISLPSSKPGDDKTSESSVGTEKKTDAGTQNTEQAKEDSAEQARLIKVTSENMAAAGKIGSETLPDIEENEELTELAPVIESDMAANAPTNEIEPVAALETVPEPVIPAVAPEPVVAVHHAAPTERAAKESSSTKSSRKQETAKSESKPAAENAKPSQPAQQNAQSLNIQLQPVRDAINKKDWASAWVELKPLLDKNPNNTTMLNMAVQIFMRQNKNEEALTYSKTLESSSSKKTAYWVQRSKIHKALGQLDQADQALDKAIDIVGEDSVEGERYKAMKNKKEALKPRF